VDDFLVRVLEDQAQSGVEMKKGTRVYVLWEDIQASLHSEDEIEPVEAEVCGWVESDTKKYLRIVTCRYLDGGLLADRIVIPKGCVTNVVKI
jgi:hypothetical protein